MSADTTQFDISEVEVDKINMNRVLFAIHKNDHFEIEDVLSILDVETLPISIPMNVNNTIFIRDLSNFMVSNDLKPNILE